MPTPAALRVPVSRPSTGWLRAEPVWLPCEAARRTRVPAAVLDWLLHSTSLTKRLQRSCAGPFRVHLQRQDWQVPYLSEAGLLGLVPRQLALVRQVVLFCRGDAWVFARSILPAATLTGRQRCLDRLGERPLGAVLFTEPGACRGPVEFARLLPGGKLFTEATRVLADQPACLWGRRTLFYLQGKPLLVNEFFLPPIAACGPDARANLALAGA